VIEVGEAAATRTGATETGAASVEGR